MAVTVVPAKGRAARKAQAAKTELDEGPAEPDAATRAQDEPPAVRKRRGLTRRGGGRRSTDLPGVPDAAPEDSPPLTLLGDHDVDDAPSPLPALAPPDGDAVHMHDCDTPPLGERVISFPAVSYAPPSPTPLLADITEPLSLPRPAQPVDEPVAAFSAPPATAPTATFPTDTDPGSDATSVDSAGDQPTGSGWWAAPSRPSSAAAAQLDREHTVDAPIAIGQERTVPAPLPDAVVLPANALPATLPLVIPAQEPAGQPEPQPTLQTAPHATPHIAPVAAEPLWSTVLHPGSSDDLVQAEAVTRPESGRPEENDEVVALDPPVESDGWRADVIGSIAHDVFPSATPANFWIMPPAKVVATPAQVLQPLDGAPAPGASGAPSAPGAPGAARLSLAELPEVSPDPVAEHEVVARIVDDILASLGVSTAAPSGTAATMTGTVVGPAVPASFARPPLPARAPLPPSIGTTAGATSNGSPISGSSAGDPARVPVQRDAAASVPAASAPAPSAGASAVSSSPGGPAYLSALSAPSAAQREALRASSRRLSAATNRISVAEITAQEAALLVEADTAALVVRSVEGPRVLWLHPAGGDGEIWGPQTLAALLGVGGAVREVIEGDPLAAGSQTALLAVPVASAGALVGTVVVRRNSAKAFTVQEQGVLDRLARMCGAALDALTRRGVLSGEGLLDDVTHLAVRDRLDFDLRAALRSRVDHEMPVMLLVAEVDGLARLRTERGASEADSALELIASSVASSLRVGDVAYRFGTDELAVLLPSTQAEDAELVAERLTAAADTLVAQRLDHPRPLRLRAAVVPVEGVAEEVMAEASRALATERVKDRWTKRRPTPNR